MAGTTLKTEAIVLRSIRYGEADRILHLYTRERGSLGAIARGARKAKSRFGGRLEPPTRVDLLLHEGRGDLLTVTGVETVSAYHRLREHGATIDAAGRTCDAVARLLDGMDPNDAAYNLLCNQLALLDSDSTTATKANALAFRLKLLVAAGFALHITSCAACGASSGLSAFSGESGGVVCSACSSASFPFGEEACGFVAGALSARLGEIPDASEIALRQVERAISETVEHHAHVRLRAV